MEHNFSLKPFNTFGIDVHANYFATFNSLEKLEELSDLTKNHKVINKVPVLFLGGGSNILFTKDYEGTVLKNEIKGIEKVNEDRSFVYVKAGGGENWHDFVLHCIKEKWGGVENLSLIPGSVGAAPIQNIGAYGVELRDVFHSLEAFNFKDKTIKVFSPKDCSFGYRDSVFKKKYINKYIITSVTFRLSKKPVFNISYGPLAEELENMNLKELSLKAVSNAVIAIRKARIPDPQDIGNAGSFFKNPIVDAAHFKRLKAIFPTIPGFNLPDENVKLAAGWLIEKCDWKGFRMGDAGCHTEHGLVLVNYGKATGQEIYNLSEVIRQSVKEKFDIVLETEVNII
jgi:UDP-N-acetylmuramate dehydrogenase